MARALLSPVGPGRALRFFTFFSFRLFVRSIRAIISADSASDGASARARVWCQSSWRRRRDLGGTRGRGEGCSIHRE